MAIEQGPVMERRFFLQAGSVLAGCEAQLRQFREACRQASRSPGTSSD